MKKYAELLKKINTTECNNLSIPDIKQTTLSKFEKLLKGHKSLVFLVFEGTQFSHEMIAIGAMHVIIDRHGYIKKHKKPL